MNLGFNVLSAVQSVIQKQNYTIEQWESRTMNSRGIEVDSYFDPETRSAGIQPVDSKSIKMLGLDMNQIYIEIFDVQDISILTRSKNPPRISWNGYYWQPITPNGDWSIQGGWNKVILSRQREIL